MKSQEAKLYRGNEYVKSLCLIGYNDDFDEIVVENDGTMTVRAMEDVKENGQYSVNEFINITKDAYGGEVIDQLEETKP